MTTLLEQKRSSDQRRRNTPEGRERRNSASLDWYYRNKDEISLIKAARNRDIKIQLVMLLGGKCERCGWNLHPASLEFHHRDPSKKIANISVLAQRSDREALLAEVRKCELVCANCHGIEESNWDLTDVWPVTEHVQAVTILAPDEETLLNILENA